MALHSQLAEFLGLHWRRQHACCPGCIRAMNTAVDDPQDHHLYDCSDGHLDVAAVATAVPSDRRFIYFIIAANQQHASLGIALTFLCPS